MKCLSFLLISFLFTISLNAQSNIEFSCATEAIPGEVPASLGGTYIISQGTLNALFIFIQFKDDDLQNGGWPITNPPSLPGWASQFAGTGKGITQYFNVMSNGAFNLTGYIYPQVYVPQKNQNEYADIKYVNYEILQNLDSYINFAQFDNCSFNKSGKDGIVDMIFFIYRNFDTTLISMREKWTGNADLLLPSHFITNDKHNSSDASYIRIQSGFSNGSGIQMRNAFVGFDYTMYVAAHEFGHHLIGSGHIDGISNLGLMVGGPVWNASRGMISWERYKSGWLNYKDITADATFTINDYMTTSDVYRISTSATEYFLIENRQKLSQYDWAGDKGIYLYHLTGINYPLPTIDVQCADGNYNFSFNTTTKTITRLDPNPSGKDEMNYVYNYGGVRYSCYMPFYSENAVWGDEEDAFDLTNNNVYSPVTNPRSTNYANKAFSIAVEGQAGTAYTLGAYFTNPYAAPPSKPQSIKLTKIKKTTTTSSSGATVMAEPPVTIYNPKISWTANPEPNITGYEIYFKEVSSGTSWLLATVSSTTTSYIDYGNILNSSSGQVDYWVKAKNGAGKTSLASGIVSTNGDLIYKDGSEEEAVETIEVIPVSYTLLQNYPNPFNPTTTISFDLPEEANISLKVYDMLGAEVATLSEGHMPAGRHTVNFNGSNLASGIYIYKFNATSLENGKHFQKINKMMLLK